MTLASRIDTQRSAPAPRQGQGEVLLGEDWVNPEGSTDPALRDDRRRRSVV